MNLFPSFLGCKRELFDPKREHVIDLVGFSPVVGLAGESNCVAVKSENIPSSYKTQKRRLSFEGKLAYSRTHFDGLHVMCCWFLCLLLSSLLI